MDHRFREDENELPYLVSQKRDEPQRGRAKKSATIDEFVKSMDLPILRETALRNKLIEFRNAKDCTEMNIEYDYGAYDFIFIRENRYIRTTYTFEFLTEMDLDRIFTDCYTTHNYDNLLNDSRFQDLIEGVGLEFIGCTGGYKVEIKYFSEFLMPDELDLSVWFDAGSKKRSYKLDLDRMELNKDYFEFNKESIW